MSLAIEITECQQRLAVCGARASAQVRGLKGCVPPVVYEELMLSMCEHTAAVNQFKVLLGTLRMIGELEQRPEPVTVERLELFAPQVRPLSEGERGAMLGSLHAAGDFSLDEGPEDAARCVPKDETTLIF